MSESSADSGIIPLEEPARPVRAEPPPPPPRSGKTVLCPACNYDVSGIVGDTCPECGTNILRCLASKARRDRAAAEYRASLKMPLLMLGVGLLGSSLMYGLTYGWVPAIGLEIFLLIKIALAVFVFFVLTVVWIGQSDHFGAMLLKVAGIYATLELGGALFDQVPVLDGIVGWIILGLVYLGMLQHMLDLEGIEAIIVAFITFIVRTLLIIFLMAFFLTF